jgi:ATP-dependent DNA helicase RecG
MSTSLLRDQIRGGETERTEFKSRVDRDGIGTAVASFLNAGGGTVLVGIDEEGAVVGVPDPHENALQLWRSLAARLSPTALFSANVEEVDGKSVIVIDVPPGEDAPYVYDGRITVRRGTQSHPATAQEISSLILSRHAPPLRWERLPALGCTVADLDQSEILLTARQVAERQLYDWNATIAPQRVLEELNLVRDESLLNSAVILFGRSPARFYPQSRVRLARFTDEDQSEFRENRVLEGHAFALLQQIESFLTANVPILSSLPAHGFQRRDTPQYPWAALREGVMNALVHRDYAAFDGGVSISIFPTRIEIWNSGRLPEGLSVEDLKRGSISRPHNPDIAHVFFLRGFIERVGIGARRIVTECLDAGLPEPTWEERAGGLLLTLRQPEPHRDISPLDLSLRQIAFLEETTPGQRLTAAQYHDRFARGVSDRQARQDLTQLVDAGFLSRIGSGRSTFYVRTDRRMS